MHDYISTYFSCQSHNLKYEEAFTVEGTRLETSDGETAKSDGETAKSDDENAESYDESVKSVQNSIDELEVTQSTRKNKRKAATIKRKTGNIFFSCLSELPQI